MKKIKLSKKLFYRLLYPFTLFLYVLIGFFIGVVADKWSDGQLYNILLFRKEKTLVQIQEEAVPKDGYKLNIAWKDLGLRMKKDGVIDETKLAQVISGTDKLPEAYNKYLSGSAQKIELTRENSHFWLDVLWGLGLANKNKLLESGELQQGGNPSQFASTGGYSLGKEDPMTYYSKFPYLPLSDKQQKRVEEIGKGIYRPCCGNSTAFPDCNHGMAMLGLIELLVYQNYSADNIYRAALAFNSMWFPQTYWDIAYHFEKNEKDYSKVPPQKILSKTFSNAMGYAVIQREVSQVEWPGTPKSGGGCSA